MAKVRCGRCEKKHKDVGAFAVFRKYYEVGELGPQGGRQNIQARYQWIGVTVCRLCWEDIHSEVDPRDNLSLLPEDDHMPPTPPASSGYYPYPMLAQRVICYECAEYGKGARPYGVSQRHRDHVGAHHGFCAGYLKTYKDGTQAMVCCRCYRTVNKERQLPSMKKQLKREIKENRKLLKTAPDLDTKLALRGEISKGLEALALLRGESQ